MWYAIASWEIWFDWTELGVLLFSVSYLASAAISHYQSTLPCCKLCKLKSMLSFRLVWFPLFNVLQIDEQRPRHGHGRFPELILACPPVAGNWKGCQTAGSMNNED